MIAAGADPGQLAGLMIGAHMRELRAQGVTKEMYLEACELLWNNDNPPDMPVDEDEKKLRQS